MADHKELSAENLKIVRRAVKTPRKNLLNDAERKFVSETKARLDKFGDGLFLSEKQFVWLEKIANRTAGAKAASSPPTDQPAYDDLAGE